MVQKAVEYEGKRSKRRREVTAAMDLVRGIVIFRTFSNGLLVVMVCSFALSSPPDATGEGGEIISNSNTSDITYLIIPDVIQHIRALGENLF